MGEFDVLAADTSEVYIIWDASGTVQGRNSCGLSYPLNLEVIECRLAIEGGKGTGNVSYAEVYPNPTSGTLNIRFAGENDETCYITLHDVTGRALMDKQVKAQQGLNLYEMDLSKLKKGMYFINIKSASLNKTIRISLQ